MQQYPRYQSCWNGDECKDSKVVEHTILHRLISLNFRFAICRNLTAADIRRSAKRACSLRRVSVSGAGWAARSAGRPADGNPQPLARTERPLHSILYSSSLPYLLPARVSAPTFELSRKNRRFLSTGANCYLVFLLMVSVKSSATHGSLPTTQASCPGITSKPSSGPIFISAPSESLIII